MIHNSGLCRAKVERYASFHMIYLYVIDLYMTKLGTSYNFHWRDKVT